MIDRLNEKMKNRYLCKKIRYGDVVLATLGNEAGILGAAFLGRQGETAL